jgi:hypothetical protein
MKAFSPAKSIPVTHLGVEGGHVASAASNTAAIGRTRVALTQTPLKFSRSVVTLAGPAALAVPR